MIFVDANILLRALTRSDQPEIQRMCEIAAELFRRADRAEVELTTSDAIVAEAAFILTSKAHYALPVDDAAARLAALLRPSGVRLRDKRIVLQALDIWAEHPRLGFVDALTAAFAQRPGTQLATFDADFDRFPDIERWTPGEGE